MKALPLLASLGLAAGLAAGCATAPPPAAAVTFAGGTCASAPDLAKAISLTPEKPKTEYVVTTAVGADAACLGGSAGARPYVVYALPKDPTGKTLIVGGLLEQTRIFSPEVAVLDGSGQTTRSFRADDYYYRGPVYSVQFEPKAGEAYLLVAADPARVGRRYDSVATGVETTATYVAGVGAITIRRGLDQRESRTFSYDGQVQVTVDDATAKPVKTAAKPL